ncbi:hypothetical protein [Actinokineospora sp. NPDC004072]
MTTTESVPGSSETPEDWVIGGRAPTWPRPRTPEDDDYEPTIVRGLD